MSVSVSSFSRRYAFAAALFGLGLGGVMFTGVLAGHESFWVNSVPYTLASVWAGTAVVWVSRGFDAAERKAWLLLGLGTLCWSVADVMWLGYEIVEVEVPYPGWPDLFYLAAYPFWMSGLVAFPYAKGSRFAQWRLMLDGLAGTAALSLLMWHAYLKDVVSAEGASLLERLVNPAYPFGDVVLLSGLVILSVRRSPHRLHRPLLMLAMAFTLNAAADIKYWLDFDSYVLAGWLDGLWVVAYGLTALAVWSATLPVKLREVPDRLSSIRTLIVPYALVSAVMLVTGYQVAFGGGTIDAKVLQLGAGVISLLVIARQSLSLKELGETVERERRDLVASLSHELRTPLTAMTGFAEVLADAWGEFPDQERHDMVKNVSSQTRYLSRIVTDLIEVSRDNLERTRLSLGSHDVAEVVTEAVGYVNVAPGRLSIDVRPGAVMLCDKGRVVQAIVNLLSNAARYGQHAIVIRSRHAGRSIAIEVHDDGPGVPVKYRELIWERFERGAHRYDATVPGTGLGLAIVKGLAQAHGGSVAYTESELLGGGCFSITLPSAVSSPETHFAGDSDRVLTLAHGQGPRGRARSERMWL